MSGPGSCELDDDMNPPVLPRLTLLHAKTWPPVAGRRPTVWSGPYWWWGGVLSPLRAAAAAAVPLYVHTCVTVCVSLSLWAPSVDIKDSL